MEGELRMSVLLRGKKPLYSVFTQGEQRYLYPFPFPHYVDEIRVGQLHFF